jgi:type III pantothenate kinase
VKLLMDVGNTTVNLGLVIGDSHSRTWRIHTNSSVTPDELWLKITSLTGLDKSADPRIVLASVVPELSRTIRSMADDRLSNDPYFLTAPWDEVSIDVDTDFPDEVGPDRVAGAEAMYEEYGSGIVVDFGTATTIDYIDADGAYRGGVILPGPHASSRGLAGETALLPSISPDEGQPFQFGNTRDALETGLLYGMAGSVSRIVDEFRDHGFSSDDPVVATGGHAEPFLDLCSEVTDHEPDLVLSGLHSLGNGLK